MVHNLKLNGNLFHTIRTHKQVVVPICSKKVGLIEVGDTIEFLSLADRQHKIRVSVCGIHRASDMEAEINVEMLRWTSADMARTSRFLSLILRHKPEVIGISLDEHGWADVDALIEGIGKKQYLTRELLEDIVRADEKGRYAFSDDGTKIRAVQGHSISVDVELTEAMPPDRLYHGTGEKYLESIQAEGILPKSRLYVHLSAHRDTAKSVGARHGKPVVLTVDTAKMTADGYIFYLSENGVWLGTEVPTKYITFDHNP